MQKKYNETVLENGLRIISHEKQDSQISTIALYIKGGARYENKDQHGYSHILEHMFFKGTKKRPSAFSLYREVDKLGIYYNAQVQREGVYFVFQFPNKETEFVFDILSDMLLNSLIDKDVLEKEKMVILEELKGIEENNKKLSMSLSFEKLFGEHPLSNRPIGNISDIKEATQEKLLDYLKDFYVPQKSAIISVGGISHEDVVLLSKKYFGKWLNSQKNTNIENKKNIKSEGEKILFKERNDVSQTQIAINYLTPGAVSIKEEIVLSIVSNYLGYKKSSLLQQELREKKGLVYDISVDNQIFTDAGKFTINISTTNHKDVLGIVFDLLDNLLTHFTNDLFEETKNQKINVLIRENEAPINEVNFLGEGFVLHNRLFSLEEYVSIIKEITYEDVKETINKYLTKEKRHVAMIGPKNI